MIDISIIIVTYNSKWFELKATIKSVLMQKGINYEIIFADDGSKIKWNEKIREYVIIYIKILETYLQNRIKCVTI